MRISNQSNDETVLRELGQRAEQIRLQQNVTQAELAREIGVTRSTIVRFEAGHSISSANLVRILRGLELLPGLELLVPEPLPSPIDQVRARGGRRRRARPGRSARTEQPKDGQWSWGDDDQ